MTFIDFPEPFYKQSGEDAKRRYHFRDTTRVRVGDVHKYGCLGYKLPDGTLRPVYSPYVPSYPEGSEPGHVTVHATFTFYPNATHGYENFVTDFKALAA